ncbi:MAG: DNA translocase FtsK [Methylobacteriaceae bacterium]|nr:DNA translocase FtsK [Methylobacteriaceae bacterium]
MRSSTLSATLDHIPVPIRAFVARRMAEGSGILILGLSAAYTLSLVTWSVRDPSLNHATAGPIRNLLGFKGAIVADLTMQLIGIAAVALLLPPLVWSWRLVRRRHLDSAKWRLILWLGGTICAAGLASLLPVTDRWPLPTGLGGVFGDALLSLPRRLIGGSHIAVAISAAILLVATILCLAGSIRAGARTNDSEEEEDFAPRETRSDDDAAGEPGLFLVALGALIHGLLSVRAALRRSLINAKHNWSKRAQSAATANLPAASPAERREPSFAPPTFDPTLYAPPSVREANAHAPRSVNATITPVRRTSREPARGKRNSYQLPALQLLSEAKKIVGTKISEEALEQNARLLEGVLDDFGVKGEIIQVRPGPVVTLYELEPAPGIKSSRVIGLADDIARSMSAVSARVAVVQGRNAIGIELPNQKRETVFLRELLASQDFDKTKHRLAIALGKMIGGEPVIVDLARMPHLLVAGTTGSGKSVAINTMILSLLYRLKPEECRLIMIDPKMLELSVYDGIPHLLTPVVTDPKKAVVALKWAVREMEDRYKKMSKVGVRNIDGFNARVAEADAKGETITRTVQTGYDKETGEAIYEQEEMELSVLPYIVVIVDEMADLMMVAGKDIEGAIQRLAQMARAAGIHLIMATQRPSVDVITGTIKANFPTRISFQVTSKIDSRTILGEQGAEQLLGQGDMLYMAGGGRISRVHGPFVSDTEVERVVAHLKSQGQPEYLDAITAEDEEPESEGELPSAGSMDAEEAMDLYDRAVAIVLRDRKCSTSYIQRRLSVGYNKAASLVERMEKEGVVAPANHSGKREILVGGGVDRGAFDLRPVE